MNEIPVIKPKWLEPDPDTMARLRGQVSLFRSARQAANDEKAKMNALIVQAKIAGYSYREIREATDMSIQYIQNVLLKAGYKEPG